MRSSIMDSRLSFPQSACLSRSAGLFQSFRLLNPISATTNGPPHVFHRIPNRAEFFFLQVSRQLCISFSLFRQSLYLLACLFGQLSLKKQAELPHQYDSQIIVPADPPRNQPRCVGSADVRSMSENRRVTPPSPSETPRSVP